MQTIPCSKCKNLKEGPDLTRQAYCDCPKHATSNSFCEKSLVGPTNNQYGLLNKQKLIREAELSEISNRINKTGPSTSYTQRSNDTTRKSFLDDSGASCIGSLSANHKVNQANVKQEVSSKKIEDLIKGKDILEQNEEKLEALNMEKGSIMRDQRAELQSPNKHLNHQKNLDELEKENKNLNLEIQELLQDKEKCTQQLHTELMSLTERHKQIESQEADHRSKLNVLEDKNKTLEKDLSNFNETKLKSMIFEESLKIKEDENQRLKLDNQRLKNELSKQKQANVDLEKANAEFIKENSSVLRYKEKRIEAQDFKEFYDCRILADSFFPLLQNKSWLIEYNNQEKYKLLKTQNTTKVAVLGYENSGKSFLLSKLTGSDLPQGTLMKTTGICLKYPSEKYLPWTSLDTPGTNISVKTRQMKENMAKYFEEKNLSEEDRMRLLLGDNILIENLLQKFVVKHAQVLLVVVGKLHRGDQKLINRIKTLPGKRIMIVHNLLDVKHQEDMEKIIQEDICQTFSVTEKSFYLEKIESGKGEGMNTKVYLENDVQRDKAVEHIVMAHEGSPAGNYYNESAINYIKTTITAMPFAQPFDLVDAFLQHLNKNLKNYLHSKNTAIGDPFILESDESGPPKALRLSDHLQYDLKLSSADEFGLIRTFSREGLEHVPHTVKIVHEESDTRTPKALRFEFEIVGHYQEEDIKGKVHQCTNNQVRLEIRGKSKDNTIRVKDSIIENTRKFGEFTIVTQLINLEGYVTNPLEKSKKITSEVPGLMILEWNLYPPAEGSLD